MLRLFETTLRTLGRLEAAVRTRAAWELIELGPRSRLTTQGRIQNIRGPRSCIRVGGDCVVAGELLTYGHGGEIRIGDHVFIGPDTRIWSAARIAIGSRVLISHGVNIIDNDSHPIDAAARAAHAQAILSKGHPRSDPGIEAAPITIGDDAWISYGAAVMRGVTIGAGAIVGACAVVTRDVAPWTVVVGNPAREVRQLAPPTSIGSSLSQGP